MYYSDLVEGIVTLLLNEKLVDGEPKMERGSYNRIATAKAIRAARASDTPEADLQQKIDKNTSFVTKQSTIRHNDPYVVNAVRTEVQRVNRENVHFRDAQDNLSVK